MTSFQLLHLQSEQTSALSFPKDPFSQDSERMGNSSGKRWDFQEPLNTAHLGKFLIPQIEFPLKLINQAFLLPPPPVPPYYILLKNKEECPFMVCASNPSVQLPKFYQQQKQQQSPGYPGLQGSPHRSASSSNGSQPGERRTVSQRFLCCTESQQSPSSLLWV